VALDGLPFFVHGAEGMEQKGKGKREEEKGQQEISLNWINEMPSVQIDGNLVISG